ncbi:uncharacterized protein LOC121599018 [Anopheles merus]|uniref:uncharacterized protein LOC121599018 n=1 Tax=Anopheles merus TaxID=30066 RepID=UPI001BE4D4C2|nr:uncharacterized protein LOC121599018 [Anopheles merus]
MKCLITSTLHRMAPVGFDRLRSTLEDFDSERLRLRTTPDSTGRLWTIPDDSGLVMSKNSQLEDLPDWVEFDLLRSIRYVPIPVRVETYIRQKRTNNSYQTNQQQSSIKHTCIILAKQLTSAKDLFDRIW